MRHATLVIFFLLATALHAQQTFRGRMVDAATGEPLPWVTIRVSGKNETLSNAQGCFVVTARPTDEVEFSHVGYATVKQTMADAGGDIEIRPLQAEDAGMTKDEIDHVLHRLRSQMIKSMERQAHRERLYFYRSFIREQGERRLAEAVLRANSACNLRRMEYVTATFYNDVPEETSGELPLYLRRTLINNVLQLGPAPTGVAEWRTLVAVPLFGTETPISRKYHLRCDALKADGRVLGYKICLTPRDAQEGENAGGDVNDAPTPDATATGWHYSMLAGCLYLDSQRRLTAFDGKLTDYGIETAHRGWVPAKCRAFITYTRRLGVVEVKSAVGTLSYDGIESDAFALRLPKKAAETVQPTIVLRTQEEDDAATEYLKTQGE